MLVPAAQAQDDGRYNDAAYSNDTESVTVYAPHFHIDRSSPLGAPDRVSLSRAVPYNDLDLRSPQDAHELRVRVATAAREICDQLQDATQTPEARATRRAIARRASRRWSASAPLSATRGTMTTTIASNR